MSAIINTEIRSRLQDILKDEQKDFQVIENSIFKLGVSVEAPEKLQALVETI